MKRLIAVIVSAFLLLSFAGCGASTNTNGVPDPDKIVPKRGVLVENLENRVSQTLTPDEIEILIENQIKENLI